jgi:hypothetical protein
MLRGNRAIHTVTAGLLTFLVVVSISLATFYMVSAEIERGKQRRDVDVLRESMLMLYAKAKGLQTRKEGYLETFSLSIPAGTLHINPRLDLVNLTVTTKYNHDPGGTDVLNITVLPSGGVKMVMRLPVDLVTSNTVIDQGQHSIGLKVEKVGIISMGNWTLNANGTAPQGVSTVTGNYYSTSLDEAPYGFDLNGDGDEADSWYIYICDPGEEFVFDTAVLHDSDDNLVGILNEGDTFRLGDRPFTATTVKERKVVLRYVRARLSIE